MTTGYMKKIMISAAAAVLIFIPVLFSPVICVHGASGKKSAGLEKISQNDKLSSRKLDLSGVMLGENVTVYQTYIYSNKDLRYLTSIIMAEAGNQPYRGMVAVGNVVMNRLDSADFPNTIRGVIVAPGQFSPVDNGSFSKMYSLYRKKKNSMVKKCKKAAKAAMAGSRPVGDKLYFRSNQIEETRSMAGEGNYQIIGGHIFYNYPK